MEGKKNNIIEFSSENAEVNEETVEILNKIYCQFYDDAWEQHKMEEVCLSIKEWRSERIQIYGSQNFKFFKNISHIIFPNLFKLTLRENCIESIENLSRVFMPGMKQLTIGYNRINKLKNLRKGYWLQLKKLYFEKNVVLDGEYLTELRLNFLEDLNIEFHSDDSNQCLDVKWMAKVEGKLINEFEINSTKRIYQSFLIDRLKKKYINLKINTDEDVLW